MAESALLLPRMRPFRDPHGRPAAPRSIERVARIIALVGVLGFTLAALWEIGGPFPAGHAATGAAACIAADNMSRWDVYGPVLDYMPSAPDPSDYYCGKPWGLYWLIAIAMKVFGRNDFGCRFTPTLFAVLTPPVLYALARALWGPIAGAIGVIAYVALPVTLSYANQVGFESPTIFGVTLASWGYVRMCQTWRRRFLLPSVLGFAVAVASDWPALTFAAIVLGFGLLRATFFRRRWFQPIDARRFVEWWALASAVTVALMLVHVYAFHKSSGLGELLEQRWATTSDVLQALLLASRGEGLAWGVSYLGEWIGWLAAISIAIRIVWLRHDLEVPLFGLLGMATLGAHDSAHYFAPYLALALGAVTASLEASSSFLMHAAGSKSSARLVELASLVSCALIPLAILPDGIRALGFAHRAAPHPEARGTALDRELDKTDLMRWLALSTERTEIVSFDKSVHFSWSQAWPLHRPAQVSAAASRPPGAQEAALVLDSRFALSSTMKQLAEANYVRAIGPYWTINRREGHAPIDGFALAEKPTDIFRKLFVYAADPKHAIVQDAFQTWELREHYAQTPNPVPDTPPNGIEQRRIRHNAALHDADFALAERLRREIEAELDRSVAVHYSDGTELIGQRIEHGALTRLVLVFQASGPTVDDREFLVRSRLVRGPLLSLVPWDADEYVLGMPFAIPSNLWKKGYLYATFAQIRRRPGTAVVHGQWKSIPGPAPKALDGRDDIDLLKE